MQSNTVTLGDVAKSCGMSVSAVSQILRDRGRFSEETRRKVKACARKLRYAPDAVASLLAGRRVTRGGKRGMPLALISVESGKNLFPNELHVATFRRLASRHGHTLTVHKVSNSEDALRRFAALERGGVQGIFFPSFRVVEALPEEAVASFALVALGQYDAVPRHHSVHHEMFHSLRALLRETVARGYRRILPLMVPHEPMLIDDQERFAAVAAIRAEFGENGPVLAPVSSRREELDVAAEVRRARADAVVGMTPMELYLLQRAGIAVPGRVGFAGMNVLPGTISGSLVPVEEVTLAAVDLMMDLLRAGSRGTPAWPRHVRLLKPFHEGETLPRRR